MLWMLLAASGPTYLTCAVPAAPTPFAVELALDEAQGRATISIPSTGAVYTEEAAFAPDKVLIRDAHSTWTIDRVTLAAQRAYSFGKQPNVDSGKCELKPAPAKRAF